MRQLATDRAPCMREGAAAGTRMSRFRASMSASARAASPVPTSWIRAVLAGLAQYEGLASRLIRPGLISLIRYAPVPIHLAAPVPAGTREETGGASTVRRGA